MTKGIIKTSLIIIVGSLIISLVYQLILFIFSIIPYLIILLLMILIIKSIHQSIKEKNRNNFLNIENNTPQGNKQNKVVEDSKSYTEKQTNNNCSGYLAFLQKNETQIEPKTLHNSSAGGVDEVIEIEILDGDDVIDITDRVPEKIPKVQNSVNFLEITSHHFTHLKSYMKGLSKDGYFYLNSLDIPYRRAILDNRDIEIHVVRLYLVLCKKLNKYLLSQGDSLKNRVERMSVDYFDYDNTLYTLFCISEFSIEELYFGESFQGIDYSLHLLEKQIDKKSADFIVSCLDVATNELPKLSDKAIERLNRNLSFQQKAHLLLHTLGFKKEQKILLKYLFLHSNKFLEIEQFLKETLILYIKISDFVNQRALEYDRRSLIKFYEDISKYHQHNYYYESKMSKIHRYLFSLIQNKVKIYYGYTRLEDIEYINQTLTDLIGGVIYNDVLDFLDKYKPETKITKKSEIKLNATLKARWKGKIEEIRTLDLDNKDLIQSLKNLEDLNYKNPNVYKLYFESFKLLSTKDKTLSLYYYYKYYNIIKQTQDVNKHKISMIPSKVSKTIFNNNYEDKHKEFINICNYGVSNPNLPSKEILQKIEEIFIVKRKRINLKKSVILKAQEQHSEMTKKLNEVLQGEEVDNKNVELDHMSVAEVEEINKKHDIASNHTEIKIDLDSSEVEIINLFKEGCLKVNEDTIIDFARSKKIFQKSIIKNINQKFYDIHEDVLIEYEDGKYFILDYNYKLIYNDKYDSN